MVEVFNYKTHIFDVDMDENLHIKQVGDTFNEKLMPVCLKKDRTPPAVEQWIKSRVVPNSRIGLKDVRSMFNNIPTSHNMFSLTDQYWFRWHTNESWQSRNFFTNEFPTEYGRMFFEPWTVDAKKKIPEGPDMTTNGVLRKRWKQEKDRTATLIKMGDRDAHQDSISEVLASMTLERLNIIPFVRYDLVVDGLRFCCSCKNFIGIGEEFVPAGDVYFLENKEDGEDRRTHLLKMIRKYTPEIKDPEDFLDRMAVADYCTCNNDRHAYNFGFIRDCRTGKMKGFAPLFDSGSAFFGNANKDGAKAKIFSDEQIVEAMERVLPKLPESTASRLKQKDLVEFVDSYPMLTDSEKKEIMERINSVYEEMRKKISRYTKKREISPDEQAR